MSLKRVSASYTRRLPILTKPRRVIYHSGRVAKQAQAVPRAHEIAADNTVVAIPPTSTSGADFSEFRANEGRASSRIAIVDYHGIISNAVTGLIQNTVEARHTIYECARQIVFQRLSNIRPKLPAELFKLEQLSLDLAIKNIEAEEINNQMAATPVTEAAPAAAKDLAPVIVVRQRTDLPQGKQFNDGARRLFIVAAVAFIGFIGYWLATGNTGPSLTMLLKDAGSQTNLVPAEQSASPQLLPAPAAQDAANTWKSSGSTSATIPIPSPRKIEIDTQSEIQVGTAGTNVPAVSPLFAVSGVDDRSAVLAVDPDANLAASVTGCSKLNNLDARALCANTDHVVSDDGFERGFNGGAPYWITQSDNLALAAMRLQRTDLPLAGSRLVTAQIALSGVQPQKTVNAAARQLFAIAVAHANRGDVNSAVRNLSEAVAIDPQYTEAYVQRGQLQFKGGNVDSAMEDFNKALAIDPRNPGAYRSRGLAFHSKGDVDRAIVDLTRAIQFTELHPARMSAMDMFDAHRSRAALYEKKQLYGRELVDLSALINAYWNNPDLAGALSANYGEQGTAGLLSSIYQLRAGVYLKLANVDGAIADLSHALRLFSPNALPLIIQRAHILESAGRRADAAEDYERALRLSPENEEIKGALARLRGNSKP